MKNTTDNILVISDSEFDKIVNSKYFTAKRKKAQETLERIGLPDFDTLAKYQKEKGIQA